MNVQTLRKLLFMLVQAYNVSEFAEDVKNTVNSHRSLPIRIKQDPSKGNDIKENIVGVTVYRQSFSGLTNQIGIFGFTHTDYPLNQTYIENIESFDLNYHPLENDIFDALRTWLEAQGYGRFWTKIITGEKESVMTTVKIMFSPVYPKETEKSTLSERAINFDYSYWIGNHQWELFDFDTLIKSFIQFFLDHPAKEQSLEFYPDEDNLSSCYSSDIDPLC